MTENKKKYHAFISYRHADNKEDGRQWATWLHQAIETYEVPKDLVGTKNKRDDQIPSRIYPIFRDEEELPADADLAGTIVSALDNTRVLIVLCSPNAVQSTYVADEIDYFKKIGGANRIIAAMIDGEPNASWDKGKQDNGFSEQDECFPKPLQFEYDENGQPTERRAEPIAADFRINNGGMPEQGWTTPEAYRQHLSDSANLDRKQIDIKVEAYAKQCNLMLLKIIAGILGVPLGGLTQRDKEYQLQLERNKARQLKKWLIAIGLLAIISIGTGLFAYMQKNQAVLEKNKNFKVALQSQSKLAGIGLQNNEIHKSVAQLNEVLKQDVDGILDAYVPLLDAWLKVLQPVNQYFSKQPNDRFFVWRGKNYIKHNSKIQSLPDGEVLAADFSKNKENFILITRSSHTKANMTLIDTSTWEELDNYELDLADGDIESFFIDDNRLIQRRLSAPTTSLMTSRHELFNFETKEVTSYNTELILADKTCSQFLVAEKYRGNEYTLLVENNNELIEGPVEKLSENLKLPEKCISQITNRCEVSVSSFQTCMQRVEECLADSDLYQSGFVDLDDYSEDVFIYFDEVKKEKQFTLYGPVFRSGDEINWLACTGNKLGISGYDLDKYGDVEDDIYLPDEIPLLKEQSKWKKSQTLFSNWIGYAELFSVDFWFKYGQQGLYEYDISRYLVTSMILGRPGQIDPHLKKAINEAIVRQENHPIIDIEDLSVLSDREHPKFDELYEELKESSSYIDRMQIKILFLLMEKFFLLDNNHSDYGIFSSDILNNIHESEADYLDHENEIAESVYDIEFFRYENNIVFFIRWRSGNTAAYYTFCKINPETGPAGCFDNFSRNANFGLDDLVISQDRRFFYISNASFSGTSFDIFDIEDLSLLDIPTSPSESNGAVISADGSRLAVIAPHEIWLYQIGESGKIEFTDTFEIYKRNSSSYIETDKVAFINNNELLVLKDDGTLLNIDIEKLQERWKINKHSNGSVITMSPNGKLFAVSSLKQLRIYSTFDGSPLTQPLFFSDLIDFQNIKEIEKNSLASERPELRDEDDLHYLLNYGDEDYYDGKSSIKNYLPIVDIRFISNDEIAIDFRDHTWTRKFSFDRKILSDKEIENLTGVNISDFSNLKKIPRD